MTLKDEGQESRPEDKGEGDAAVKSRRGGGGAHRAFIHEHAKQQRLRAADLQRLNSEYRCLSWEQLAHYKRLGAQATALHASGVPSFPCHSERASRKRAHGGEAEGAAKKKKERMRSNQCRDASSDIPDGFVEDVMSGGRPNAHSFHGVEWEPAAESLLRALGRFARSTKLQHQQHDAALEKKLWGEGAQQGKAFLEDRALLQKMSRSQYLQHPHNEDCRAFLLASTPRSLLQSPPSTSVEGLARMWQQRHVGIEKKSWPSQRSGKPPTVCRRRGFCTCKGEGKKTQQIFSRAQHSLKQYCASDVEFQNKLMAGRVLLHFQGVAAATTDAEASSGMVGEQFFFHVSFQTKRPWNSTGTDFQHASSTPCPPLPWTSVQAAEVGHRHFTMKVAAPSQLSVRSLFQLLQEFDLKLMWYMQVWLLSARSVPAQVGGALHAVPLDVGSTMIWSAIPKQKAQRPQPMHVEALSTSDRAVQPEVKDDESLPSNGDSEVEEPEEDEYLSEGNEDSDTIAAELQEAEASVEAAIPARSGSSSSSNSSSKSSSSTSSDSDAAHTQRPEVQEPCQAQSQRASPAPGQKTQRAPAADGLRVFDQDGVLQGVIRENRSLLNMYCTCQRHEGCVKSRTYKPGMGAGAGRPVGFLAAWARASSQYPDKVSHVNNCKPDFEARKIARAAAEREWNAESYLELERPPLEQENGREPPVVPRR